MSEQFPLERYFARVGFNGTPRPDFTTLAALHAAQPDAIPFEAIDPFVRRPVTLDLPTVTAKLVGSRRGGYCFEQNVLFKAALDAIGFNVTGLTARVRWMSPPDSPLGPREHMLMAVDLPEGRYLADVGFGACVMDAPLRLKTGVEQRTALGTFLLTEADGLFSLAAKQPGGWRTMYLFDLAPQIHADYELGNWYTSTSPFVPFGSLLIMERVGKGRRYKLINDRFIVEARDGEVEEERRIASSGELSQVLDETFNIVPPVPAEDIFARVCSQP